MAKKGRITKKEKQRIIQILLGIGAFALLSPAIHDFIDGIFPTNGMRFFVGIALLVILALIGKLKV